MIETVRLQNEKLREYRKRIKSLENGLIECLHENQRLRDELALIKKQENKLAGVCV